MSSSVATRPTEVRPFERTWKHTRRFIAIVTIIRIIVSLVVPSRTSIHDSGWRATLVDSDFTLRHLREGRFLLDLDLERRRRRGRYYVSYARSLKKVDDHFRQSPLLTAVIEPFVLALPRALSGGGDSDNDDNGAGAGAGAGTAEDLWRRSCFAVLIAVVDLFVATGLARLVVFATSASQMCTVGDDDLEESETETEKRMEGRIRPAHGWIFGIPSFTLRREFNTRFPPKTDDDDDDEGNNDDTSNGDEHRSNNSYSDHLTEDLKNEKNVNYEMVSVDLTDEWDDPPSLLPLETVPSVVLLLYYCNPISIVAAHVFHSFRSISYLLHVSTLLRASHGDAPTATFLLALATHLDFRPVVFLVPVSILVYRKHHRSLSATTASIVCIGLLFFWSIVLYVLSRLLINDDHWIPLHYRYRMGYHDLSPNLGIVWYFFVQMFNKFKEFYVVLFNGLPFLFVVPTSLRLHRCPTELATCLLFTNSFFGAHANLQEAAFVLVAALSSPRVVARVDPRITIVSILAIPVPVSLFVLDYWMYLGTGSGNANYMYFQSLAFCVFAGLLMCEFFSAACQREKALCLTRKELEKERRKEKEKEEEKYLTLTKKKENTERTHEESNGS